MRWEGCEVGYHGGEEFGDFDVWGERVGGPVAFCVEGAEAGCVFAEFVRPEGRVWEGLGDPVSIFIMMVSCGVGLGWVDGGREGGREKGGDGLALTCSCIREDRICGTS